MPKKKHDLIKKDQKHQELEERLKRTMADYQNLERRIEEERKLLSKLSAMLLVEKLLPVLDNLENAQSHLKDQGLEMVIRQFKEILNQEGVEEIEAIGQQFDPNQHEAVEAQAGENENTVARVVAKGYKIEDKVIRPAKVVVTKKAATQDQKQEETYV
ncbi:MAG: Protein GrpE [Candidatus Curtissbacteria bacterium GW2011_GWA1_41_11]|uniref:Protein GrpE n=1 Tax=Candidatus Curtissbacteria bacterium GW2011_GWA1_41_11 TaxID=1618409 RepID=A0A0G0UES7_9BACT|nr:MAG: Protein GrpE [Candidatus Curtissbacteria bacterium GW2011_GWA1_41_11]